MRANSSKNQQQQSNKKHREWNMTKQGRSVHDQVAQSNYRQVETKTRTRGNKKLLLGKSRKCNCIDVRKQKIKEERENVNMSWITWCGCRATE